MDRKADTEMLQGVKPEEADQQAEQEKETECVGVTYQLVLQLRSYSHTQERQDDRQPHP